MKKIILTGLLLCGFTVFSQELAAEIKLKLTKERNVFQIIDDAKKEVSFFISDKENISAIKFNEDFKIIDSLKAPRPDLRFESMIGYSLSDSKHNVFWTSFKNKEINLQSFDFKAKTITNSVFNFDFSKEKIIQKLSINNLFYIISLVNKSNILKVYVFDKDGKLEVKAIDTTSYTLANKNGETTTLYKVFEESFMPFEPSFSLKRVTNDTPTSLTFAAYKRKIYTTQNEIIFSFDNCIDFTQLYKLNLTDFSISRTTISQPTKGFDMATNVYADASDERTPDINSNSFIINNKVFQIRLSPDLVKISVKTINGELIKEYSARYDKPIDFKNSDIIQESGSVTNTRVLETSNQFIRKLYNSNPAITCFEKQGDYYATIGSASEVIYGNSGAIIAAGMFGVAGVLLASALTYNPTLENFNSYKDRKIIYINSVFDKDMNHFPGEMKPLAFDELRKFAFSKNKDTDPTIFKFNNYLYLGGYNSKTKLYSFNRFAE